ncbi:MAG TPA: hypothetical protein VFG53_05615 [Anaeromyxobacter sp.]|nr:hypothetical protein [Anaeromyxobacter sp.]
MARPVKVLLTYFPLKGKETAFLRILKRHWSALRKARLVAVERPRIWRASDKGTRREYFVEMFAWRDREAPHEAHETPEVVALWREMEPLLESVDVGVLEPVKVRF